MVRYAIATSGPICRSAALILRTETDSLEFSELATSLEEAQAFRAHTLKHVRTALALGWKDFEHNMGIVEPASRSSILEQFSPVGCAMVKHCALGKDRVYIGVR